MLLYQKVFHRQHFGSTAVNRKFYDLQPEYGWDFEAGLKAFLFKYKMMFDIQCLFI